MSQIVSDPVGCVGQIYERFDLAFTPELEERMRRFVATHPRDEHGAHHYSLESFGLEASEIRQAFKGYCEYFGVESEPFGG